PSWDVLAVLFLVLIAPEAYKQLLAMRWGGGVGQVTTRTDTHEKTTQEIVNKSVNKKQRQEGV
ncbi:MAG: hypothetical protein NUV34_04220, partial [Sulfuricaulis sp.]|nr:hypothetical protein [Sulfuricaulis sp.]